MKTPKGTRDLLPEDARVFRHIEQAALTHFGRYGFQEIRTPMFEETRLFARGIGEDTDIVHKEMYTFEDKAGRSLTLRPELTAAVCRAVIQHNLLAKQDLVRLMYCGPMFRYERPQAGRYRQFYQLGAEVIGSRDPLVDIETIEALIRFLEPFQLPGLTLVLNSVGDAGDRPAYLSYLREYFGPLEARLCPDCHQRLQTNVLRLLDCKQTQCAAHSAEPKPISGFWSDETKRHFDTVCDGLGRLGIEFQLDPGLVRGLDYYTLTAFELLSGDLGAQSAVMGGGRYDGLIEKLGGKPTPAFGWALGIDRLVTILNERAPLTADRPDIFFVFGRAEWLTELLPLISELRAGGLTVLYDLRVGSFRSQMKRANRSMARWAAIVGDEEYQDRQVSLKNMTTSDQVKTSLTEILETIRKTSTC